LTNVEYVAVTTLIVQTAVECQMETVHLAMEHAVLADLIFLRARATAMAMSLMNAEFAEGQASLRARATAMAMSLMNVGCAAVTTARAADAPTLGRAISILPQWSTTDHVA
jgi:hypothetical protein